MTAFGLLPAFLITAILSIDAPDRAQAQVPCVAPKILTSTTAKQIDLDWCGDAMTPGTYLKDKARLSTARIDERAGVRLRIVRFNYLHFSPVVEIETTIVETYTTLDRLWKQIFSVLTLTPDPSRTALVAECQTVESCLAKWIYTAGDINAALDRALRTTTAVAVTRGDLQTLKDLVTGISGKGCQLDVTTPSMDCALDRLAQAEGRTRELYAKNPSVDIVITERLLLMAADQVKLLDRLAAFSEAVSAIENGRINPLKKQKAGTIVSVTITPAPVSPSAQAANPAAFDYFVHSRLPVTYHAGYAYSRLDDIKLEKVRTVSGADLFDQIRKKEGTNALTAFLSYELYSWPRTDEPSIAFLASLGTDFSKPGERIYAGGAVRFRRIYLNFGLATATIEEGVNPVIEDLGGALGARELFKDIGSRRNWLPFLGLSFGVF